MMLQINEWKWKQQFKTDISLHVSPLSSQTEVAMLEQYLPSTQSEIFKMGADPSKTFHFISFQNI